MERLLAATRRAHTGGMALRKGLHLRRYPSNQRRAAVTLVKGDPFRRDYGQLTSSQKKDMDEAKRFYEETWTFLEHLEQSYGKSRDLSVAKTELQTSCMWAVRAVTKTGDQE